jgi:competence protein ComEA
MDALDRRRLIAYIAFASLILAVGAWGVSRSDGGGVGDEEAGAVVVLQPEAMGGAPSSDVEAGAGSVGAIPSSPAAATGHPGLEPATAQMFIQVAGAVRRPGVVCMPAGSRVFEVIREAGGVTEEGDEQAVALAAIVTDGARVYVPRKGEVPAGAPPIGVAPSPAGLAGPAEPEKISLSTASDGELQTLPGIGPAMAARIIAFREQHGPFTSVDELDEIPGVGPATMERLRPLVCP